jgi:Predicted nucleotide-binding protein containing TIR-like domain
MLAIRRGKGPRYTMKPRVFIGSSLEGLDVAYAIQQNLEHDAEPTVWPQGAFIPSDYVLPALEEAVGTYDFGIFVFLPDDIVEIRQERQSTVRDNVLFELGLFIGRLGRQRNFIVMPRGQTEFRMPTDLLGLIFGDYDPDRQDKNLQAATGPTTNQIRLQIKKLGPRGKPTFEEAVVSRAKEEVKARSAPSPEIPDEVRQQLDDVAARLASRGLGGTAASGINFPTVWSILEAALKQVNDLMKQYGLRVGPFPNPRILLEWVDLPSCIEEPPQKTKGRPTPSSQEAGLLEWMAGTRQYESALPEHQFKWIAAYLCNLCHSGQLICAVGHHIVGPNYEKKPWTNVIRLDVSSADVLESVRELAKSFFEQAPAYYEALAANIESPKTQES